MIVEPERKVARRAFERIRSASPHLLMIQDENPDHVDMTMSIPAQDGLVFDLELNLQNVDELHLVAGGFWGEWFPCGKRSVEDRYVEAVSGLLSGEHRIVERWRADRCVLAKLQSPVDDSWQTIFTFSAMSLPWPRARSVVVRNTAAT